MNVSISFLVKSTLERLSVPEKSECTTSDRIISLLRSKLPYLEFLITWDTVFPVILELQSQEIVFKDTWSNIYFWDRKPVGWYAYLEHLRRSSLLFT